MKIRKVGYFILFSWFVAGSLCLGLYPCKNKDTQTALDIAMEKAGDNRQELEKVLRHYQQSPADSLKYKAACFLIENMPYYEVKTKAHPHVILESVTLPAFLIFQIFGAKKK